MKGKYTIILIPPGQSTTRQFQFSKIGKGYLGAGILLIGLTIISLLARNFYLSCYINDLQPTVDYIIQLKSEIKERDQKINDLNKTSAQITEDLKQITDLEDKLSTILQLHPSSSSISPSRSISHNRANLLLANPHPPLPTLDQNAQTLAEHLILLQGYYEAAILQKDQIGHTPNILPVEGEITSPHGYRRNPFGGLSKEFHNGIDIACDYGTPILATADGIITFAGKSPIFGLRIDIDHGQGIKTFYAHNSKLLVQEGDQVKKRDLIAYSGNSGRSTGCHLHYATIVNGKNVDPLTFIQQTKEI